ncbi:MAG: glycosyltransferase [Thermoleophilaceae bacterium]
MVPELEREWDVDLIALPADTFDAGGAPARRRTPWRRVASAALRAVLFDKWEPWSFRRLRRWVPDVDGALLVGYPWSPVAYAAQRLRRAGVPYVVDAGDPWTLTGREAATRLLAHRRAQRAERRLWLGAAGAIVTTPHQRDRLKALFPELRTLVRPNGYIPTAPAEAAPGGESPRDRSTLRLVHFGQLSDVRLDIVPFLTELGQSGRWSSVEFVQFGDDYVGMLEAVPPEIGVERHAVRPWEEILALAPTFDLAVVVGHRSGLQLASKTIQYQSLPIPRLALTGGWPDDALAAYVTDRPGWLIVPTGQPDAAGLVWEHVHRRWSTDDLRAPEGDSWPRVAEEISGFISDCVARAVAVRTGGLKPRPGR